MPPRKQKPTAKAAAAEEDAGLDAMLDSLILANQAVPGSPAALRLEQEQREARERAEQEQREARERAEQEQCEAREKAAAEAEAALHICGECGAGGATMKCSSCATVRYCGARCQKAHWPAHKARCRELKAEAEAAAEAEAVRRDEEEEEVTFNPDTERGNCWTCGADNPHHLCNRCKVTKYCGVACQTENWPIHKGRCAELKTHAAEINERKGHLRKLKGGPQRSQDDLIGDLYNACMLGRIVDIERIIVAGGGVNVPDEEGFRAIHGAAQEGHARAIRVLMRHGAQVNAQNLSGHTACQVASQNGHVKAVAALLDHGAQVDSRDNDGYSALYTASQNNQPEVVTLLLEKGAQVDLPTNKGVTALLVSAFDGHAACVRLLLQAGADPLLRFYNGLTPLEAATHQNLPEVVTLLQARIAELELERGQGALQMPSATTCTWCWCRNSARVWRRAPPIFGITPEILVRERTRTRSTTGESASGGPNENHEERRQIILSAIAACEEERERRQDAQDRSAGQRPRLRPAQAEQPPAGRALGADPALLGGLSREAGS